MPPLEQHFSWAPGCASTSLLAYKFIRRPGHLQMPTDRNARPTAAGAERVVSALMASMLQVLAHVVLLELGKLTAGRLSKPLSLVPRLVVYQPRMLHRDGQLAIM
jgi:hypothetical protein